MDVQEEQPASAALFVGGPYDGAVITVADDLEVVYAPGRPVPGLPGVDVVAYQPTVVTLFGRQVRAYVAEALGEGRAVRMTPAVRRLWETASVERESATSSC